LPKLSKIKKYKNESFIINKCFTGIAYDKAINHESSRRKE